MKLDLSRSQNVDVLFAGWFGLQAALIVVIAILELSLLGTAGDYYGPALVMVYGFIFPALFYLVYNLVVLLARWWQRKSLPEAWHASFDTTWARRSAALFGVAFLSNLVYVLIARIW